MLESCLQCCPIYHWLEVNREMNISLTTYRQPEYITRALRLCNNHFTTDLQAVIYWATHHLLARIYFDYTQERTKRVMYPSDVASFPPLHEKKSRQEL